MCTNLVCIKCLFIPFPSPPSLPPSILQDGPLAHCYTWVETTPVKSQPLYIQILYRVYNLYTPHFSNQCLQRSAHSLVVALETLPFVAQGFKSLSDGSCLGLVIPVQRAPLTSEAEELLESLDNTAGFFF